MPDGSTIPDERAARDWIRLDRLADDLGEDPGRFLDGHLDPLPRIRGLSTAADCRAWIGAERRIANIRNRAPRERVITALEQRIAYLENFEPDPDFERDAPEKTWLYHTREGEVVPYDEVDRSTALETLEPVATDGGEAE